MVRELNATETLQTDFISNISHEFKTPISAIEGYVSLLQDARQSPQEQEAYAEKILLSARRLSTLTGNILLLSKLNNQSIRPALTNFRLDEQIRQAFVSLESRWTEKNIDFDIDLNEIWYNGYEGLTIHIWTNLIDNAIKFDPQDGLIRMRLFERAARVYFVIEDNGPGIREADQKRIFNKFYQGDTSRRMEGNGLGLSLVKQIVEMSGGEIAVENLPQGGCRFTVSLPRELQS